MSFTGAVVNWKKPPEWDRFENLASEIHPSRDSCVGYELESAWHRFKQHDEYAEIVDRILEGSGGRSGEGEGEKILGREAGEGSGQTGLRLSEQVRDEMATFARKVNVPNYEVLRAVVCYWLADGTVGWIKRQLEKLESRLDLNRDPRTAKEKRRDQIIQALERQRSDGDLTGFTIGEFNRAIDEGPKHPKQADDHARETYLPLVLDELDMTWSPHTRGVFVKESEAGSQYDVRRKPKALYTDSDKVLALQIDAAEKVAESGALKAKYAKREAVSIPGLAYNNVDAYLRRAADADGFVFDEREGVLKVDRKQITDPDVRAAVFGDPHAWIDDTLEELPDDIGSMDDDVRDRIITNKVARAKYASNLDDDDSVPSGILSRVTDDDLAEIHAQLNDTDESAINAAKQELDEIARGQAVTDGGEDRV